MVNETPFVGCRVEDDFRVTNDVTRNVVLRIINVSFCAGYEPCDNSDIIFNA